MCCSDVRATDMLARACGSTVQVPRNIMHATDMRKRSVATPSRPKRTHPQCARATSLLPTHSAAKSHSLPSALPTSHISILLQTGEPDSRLLSPWSPRFCCMPRLRRTHVLASRCASGSSSSLPGLALLARLGRSTTIRTTSGRHAASVGCASVGCVRGCVHVGRDSVGVRGTFVAVAVRSVRVSPAVTR